MRTAGLELLNRCLIGGVGGMVYVKSCMLPLLPCWRLTREAYMCKDDGLYFAGSIVMWESGSYFDFMSNVIQNTPRTIRPTLTGLLNGTISMSAVNATLGLNTITPASIKPPWNFTIPSRQWNISQA